MLLCQMYSWHGTSGYLWQCYIDGPNNNSTEFESFTFQVKITGETPDEDNYKEIIEIAVPLKYLTKFWRTLEMSFFDCEINPKIALILLQLEKQI